MRPIELILAGCVSAFLASWQSRLLADHNPRRLLTVAAEVSGWLVWGFAVRQFILTETGVLWFAAGAGIGALAATYTRRQK